MNLSNIKDTLTTICAWVTGICAAVIGLPLAIQQASPTVVFTLPPIVTTICVTLGAIALITTQVLTGKNPDGSTKSVTQVTTQNTQSTK